VDELALDACFDAGPHTGTSTASTFTGLDVRPAANAPKKQFLAIPLGSRQRYCFWHRGR